MEYINLFDKAQFNKIKREILRYSDYQNYNQCTMLLEKSIKCFPAHAGLYYLLSVIYINAKEYVKAQESFKKAVVLDKEKADYFSLISLYFLGINDLESSYNYAYKAYELDNKDIEAIIVLARIEYIHKNYEDSLAFAVSAIEIDENNFRAVRLISEIYIIIGADSKETLEVLYRAETLGKDENISLDIIKVLYFNKQYVDCLRKCKDVLSNCHNGYISIKTLQYIDDIYEKFMTREVLGEVEKERLIQADFEVDSYDDSNSYFNNPIVEKIDKVIEVIEEGSVDEEVKEQSKVIEKTELKEKSLDNTEELQKSKERKENKARRSASKKEVERNSSCLEEALEKLDSLTGLEKVKTEVHKIVQLVKYENNREQVLGIEKCLDKKAYHFLFLGNPGTGKTTVARLIGDIFYYLGILETGQLIEVDRSDIVGKYVGETAKLTRKAIDKAMGGILFIDEAYTLAKGGKDSNDYGKEAIEILLKSMEDNRGEFTVILAGYTNEMRNLMKLNPGLESRINLKVNFEDYSDEELLTIAEAMAQKEDYKLTEQGKTSFMKRISNQMIDENFANARTARNILEDAIREKAFRMGDESATKEELTTLDSVDFGVDLNFSPKDNIQKLQEELEGLVGLTEVKDIVKGILNTLELNIKKEKMGIECSEPSLNMIFTGSPGTGKTTVARIMAKLLKEMGILKKGHLVEVTRNDLVGEYVGQTGPKTLDKIKQAYGGVLFIDEAYTLNGQTANDFGKEAIAVLIKEMEDNRDKFVVIMAGYTNEMKELLNLNPGLESRVKFNVEFKDYNKEELLQIFLMLCLKEEYSISKKAYEKLSELFDKIVKNKDKNFGNGRLVRKIFEDVKMKQANRIVQKDIEDKKEILRIKSEDIDFDKEGIALN